MVTGLSKNWPHSHSHIYLAVKYLLGSNRQVTVRVGWVAIFLLDLFRQSHVLYQMLIEFDGVGGWSALFRLIYIAGHCCNTGGEEESKV